MVKSAPGIGPTEFARWSIQALPPTCTGVGSSNRSTPMKTKYTDSVATTGGTRRITMISPFRAPISSPATSTIGTSRTPPNP